MRPTILLSALVLGMPTLPAIARAERPAPVACCPVETTFVHRYVVPAGAPPAESATYSCRLRSVLVSDDGRFRAGTYVMENEEGGSMVLLCDGRRTLGMQLFARAVAWEPGGSRLLCDEAAADDDLRMFVLDVGAGEYSKRGSDRLGYILGERADRFLYWAGDSIQVHNHWAPLGEDRWLRLPERKPARR